jgi:EAL domain-containing protein (putative c-di-GMP-specific phosphodiesterase class I)
MTEIQAPAAGKQQAGFTHFIQGDVLSPPLEAEAFPAVIALARKVTGT